MKWYVKTLLIYLVILGTCWIIGRVTHASIPEQINTDTATKSTWSDYNIEIIGSEITEDNPWGFTAGIIEDEEFGECILLTPGTSIVINNIDDKEMLSLQTAIHPWVAESSDGAGLEIKTWDSDEVSSIKDVEIDNNVWRKLNEINGNKIEIICNAGKTDDDSCDWVVIKIE